MRVERVEDGGEDHASLEREELQHKVILEYAKKNGESKGQNNRHSEKTKFGLETRKI